LINNRQNGRRRGRGGQPPRNGQQGTQDRGNRIDNRARGNAAQLLEKYKSLARDAQTAGDRVNTEYYLQFADHYFRVLAESRSRFDEQRPQPARTDFRDEFGQDGDDEQDGQRFEGDTQGNGWDTDDERPRQQEARQQDERPRQQDNRSQEERPRQQDNRQRDERPRQQDNRQQEGRQQDDRPRQQDNRPREDRVRQPAQRRFEEQPAAEAGAESAGAEPVQPRAERRPRRERPNTEGRTANGNATEYAPRVEAEPEVSERIEIDRLPAGFSTVAAAPVADGSDVGEAAEAPRVRRPRAPRKPKGETVTVDA